MAEHFPTESTAVLAEQQKVTGWTQPESNATGAESGVGDELNAVGDAQVVTTNAPEFVEKPEEPLDLQKGPAKKYIDNPDAPAGDDAAASSATGAVIALGAPEEAPAEAPAADATETTDAPQADTGMGDFFDAPDASATTGGAADTGMGDFFDAGGDDNNNNNSATTGLSTGQSYASLDASAATHPNNATRITLPDVGDENEDDFFGGDGADAGGYAEPSESKQEPQQEQSVLSLWEEERRKVLQERANKEREAQREMEQQAVNEKEEFIRNREERIKKAKSDAVAREKDIKLDYDSVYKNGTIWEQVAKLVDLTNNDDAIKRMRDLIIDLKNSGKS